VFEAVKQDGLALRFAAAPMRREKHIVYAACAQNASALEFTALYFRKDTELVNSCLKQKVVARVFWMFSTIHLCIHFARVVLL